MGEPPAPSSTEAGMRRDKRHVPAAGMLLADQADHRQPGRRASAAPGPLERFVPYLTARLVDDPHIWASALFDEVVALGYERTYVTFARQMRLRGCGRTL